MVELVGESLATVGRWAIIPEASGADMDAEILKELC
jgi:hypothetical protein